MKIDFVLWLVAALVPGYAIIRLCQPAAAGLPTLASAPAVSFGFCYLLGLASNRLSLSPVPTVLAASAVLTAGWLAVELWRRRSSARRPSIPVLVRLRAVHHRSPAQLASLVLLGIAIVLGGLLWRSFQSSMLVPVGWDAMHHGYFISQISRHHTMSSAIVLSSDASGHDGSRTFYPLAFNLVAAILHSAGGQLISSVMLTSTVALAGVLLPIGSYALARELDPGQPLVAGLSAIASTLPIMLYLIEGTGRLTGILGVALVPGLAVLLLSQRGWPGWLMLSLPLLGIIGIIGMHTSEAPTALLLALVCMLVRAWQGGDWTAFRGWLCWVAVAGLVSLILLVVLEPNVLHLVSQRGGAIVGRLSNGRRATAGAGLFALGSAWLVPVLGCAATALPRWRRYRGSAITLAAFLVLFYLIGTGVRRLVPTLAIPWYDDPGRVSWDLAVLAILPTAIGLAAIGEPVGHAAAGAFRFIAGLDRRSLRGHRLGAGIAPLAAAFTALLVVVAFMLPKVGREGRLASLAAGPVDRNSLAAFEYLSSTVPPGQPVLDDLRSDGAMWMYVDYGVPTLFGNAPLLGYAPHSWLEKLWLSRNLNRAGSDPCVRAMLDKYAIHYVYVGDRHLIDGWTDFSAARMSKSPAFTQVFHQGAAHVFRVRFAGLATGACSRDVTARVHW
jgi:hypothetical protein